MEALRVSEHDSASYFTFDSSGAVPLSVIDSVWHGDAFSVEERRKDIRGTEAETGFAIKYMRGIAKRGR